MGPTSTGSASKRPVCPAGMRCRSASSSSCTWWPQASDRTHGTNRRDRGGPLSARSYMSIGDVLTLLRQEFPDVTISKIRFLESQGLVNPERTPSGYRKFYDQDVERLRWVLRQQREHFLPLKVIKGRLEAGGEDLDDDFDDLPPLDDLDADPVEDEAAVVVTVVGDEIDGDGVIHSGERRRHPEPVLVGQGASLAAGVTVVGAPALAATPAAGGGSGAALPG